MPRDLIPSEIRDFEEEQHVIQEQPVPDNVMDTFMSQGREMILLREQKAKLEARETVLKKSLMEMLAEYGLPYGPEGQHRTIDFATPIRGIARFVRQSKTSMSVDETRAEAIARMHKIYDRLFVMRPVLDQDAVMVAVMEGILTDEELAEIFPKKVTHAFLVEKVKK